MRQLLTTLAVVAAALVAAAPTAGASSHIIAIRCPEAKRDIEHHLRVIGKRWWRHPGYCYRVRLERYFGWPSKRTVTKYRENGPYGSYTIVRIRRGLV